jgi:hypothetical protein
VTDEPVGSAQWPAVLRDIARASGHELRNVLNALVVNLEVVRSRADSLDDSVRPFVTQSVEQAEQSVSVAEGTIALLNLVVGAIDGDGHVAGSSVNGDVRIEASEGETARLERALSGLASRHVVAAEAADAAVILRIPDKQSEQRD